MAGHSPGEVRIVRLKPIGILETCLYAEKLQAAEEFYERVLGLTPFAKEVGRHLFFRFGEGVFLIFSPDATAVNSGDVPTHGAHGPGHVAFRIEDDEVDSWRNHLSDLGVEIERELNWPSGGRSLYFRDPAGNSLELATAEVWEIRTKKIPGLS